MHANFEAKSAGIIRAYCRHIRLQAHPLQQSVSRNRRFEHQAAFQATVLILPGTRLRVSGNSG
jgi:hypothetical protein